MVADETICKDRKWSDRSLKFLKHEQDLCCILSCVFIYVFADITEGTEKTYVSLSTTYDSIGSIFTYLIYFIEFNLYCTHELIVFCL